MTLKVYASLNTGYDLLAAKGVFPSGLHKRRDPREPGRIQKEMAEDKLEGLMKRYFSGQKKRLREFFEIRYPGRKAPFDDSDIPEALFRDDNLDALLNELFAAMALDEVALFAESIDIGIDIAQYSADALAHARAAVGELIKNIDANTLKVVREAVAGFVETPGMTIGQLMKQLPFGEVRSRLVAISEVTNIYAELEVQNGVTLASQFPGVEVVKTWFTNNDASVCIICRGLDGKTVPVGMLFISDGDGQEYDRPGQPHPGDRCWMQTRTVI